jgi:hypothetical protein
MDDARLDAAIKRVNDAIARIEATATGTTPDSDLAERHARLRDATAAAVAEIDGLLSPRKA